MSKVFSAAAICTAVIVGALTASAQETAPTQPNKIETVQEISAEKRALIMEMLEAMNAGVTFQQVFNAISEQMEKERIEALWESLKETSFLTPEEQVSVRDGIKESIVRRGKLFRERLGQRLNFGKVMEEITLELYAKYFTESELKDLVNFNKSATGKKATELTSTLMTETMNRTSERMGPVIKSLIGELAKEETPAFQKKVDELIKSHHRTPNKRNKSRTKGQ